MGLVLGLFEQLVRVHRPGFLWFPSNAVTARIFALLGFWLLLLVEIVPGGTIMMQSLWVGGAIQGACLHGTNVSPWMHHL